MEQVGGVGGGASIFYVSPTAASLTQAIQNEQEVDDR